MEDVEMRKPMKDHSASTVYVWLVLQAARPTQVKPVAAGSLRSTDDILPAYSEDIRVLCRNGLVQIHVQPNNRAMINS